ncbi:MAG: hypothetical protein BGP03_20565 [Pseudonocardia sp. 73-21]|nr:MAG: hypothetical protein BGP03_20565 [Pseudonocardia sp. 73-21]
MSRSELAEAVNAWLWESTHRRYDLDGHHIAKYERGVVRFPISPYRAALRAVLGVASDAELGFIASPRRAPSPPATGRSDCPWSADGVLTAVEETARSEVLNRRDALRSGAVAAGIGLLGPLRGWLEPMDGWTARAGTVLSVAEVEAIEQVVVVFCGWRSAGSGLGRTAVVGQLADVTDRLRCTPDGELTQRVYLAAAELAKIAGSMAFDAGSHRLAQEHYLHAVQLAKAARADSFAAVAIAALARQSYDAGESADGLELVELAQLGTRRTGTPGLRAMLATRQAWGYAQQGHVYAFHRAVDAAEDAFAEQRASDEPRWLRGLDEAELAGTIGARFRDLSRHEPGQAVHALGYIGRALDHRSPDRPRNRAMDLIGLARVHLLIGEPDRACELVADALPLLDPRHPGRLARKLGDFDREAVRYADVPAVRETRTRLRDLVSA